MSCRKSWLGNRAGAGLRFAAVVLLSAFASLASAEVFTFTAIPDQDETRLQERFGKVADYLSRELGVPVNYIPVKSYAAAVTAFRNNQVQLAWFGGLSGVQARRLVPGSEAIAQGQEDTQFKSYLIAHHRTGLQRGAELPAAVDKLSLTFGSKGSTSGRLMPEYYMRTHYGKAPGQVFSRIGFSGDHSRTIALVQAGSYDLGVLNYKVWERELAEGRIDPDKVSVIWESPTYPDYQWSIRGDVDSRYGDGFSAKVKSALLNMQQPELLQAFPRSAFIAADNEQYQVVEDVAVTTGLMDPR